MVPKTAKVVSTISLVLIIVITVLFYIPFSFSPPEDTRIILDHDKQTFIAPPCFNQADATNFIEETTYDEVDRTDYKPNSSCTEREVSSKKSTLFNRIIGNGAYD